jgi:hypothetical protein
MSNPATNLIEPHDLNLDATVPQCLDNQYVSDRTLNFMLEKKADYLDREVGAMREREIRTEFLRSLTYSSQLVMNRAFFKLNKQLTKFYSTPDDSNFNAFATLLSEKKILPFLANERSINENLDLRATEDADVALSRLLEKTGDKICCVRLAKNDAINAKRTAFLSSTFGGYLSSLRSLQADQLDAMVQELFNREVEPPEFDRFRSNLYRLADYAHYAGTVKRQKVYEKFFVVKGSSDEETEANVGKGRFLESNRENHLRELKKLVDLRYNTNLPDKLNRFTFTPVDLPTRIALQDQMPEDRQHTNEQVANFIEESLTHLKRKFMANQQDGLYLPLLENLDLPDIVKIHEFDEWKSFVNKQQSVLRDPLRLNDNLDDFQTELIKLQTKISEQYKAGKIGAATKSTLKKYTPFITLGLEMLGWGLILLGVEHKFSVAGDAHVFKILELGAADKIKGYTVKLVVNMIDLDTRRIDSDLSYSIDMMRYDNPITKEELGDLIRRIEQAGGDRVDGGKMPEQTKQV